MGLQSSDLILVERGNTLYKQTFSGRANIESSDLLLVERNNTLYKCTYSNWSSANNSDLILVERGGTLYKETKEGWVTATGGDPAATNIDIHSSNYSPTWTPVYPSSTGDITDNWKVLSIKINATNSGVSSSGNLYIGLNATAGTTYFSDFHIAAIQVLQENLTSYRADSSSGTFSNGYDWNFGRGGAGGNDQSDDDYGYKHWETTTTQITNQNNDPWDYSYTAVGAGGTGRTWGIGHSTSTNYVGADGGIYQPTDHSGGGGSILSASGNISQTGSNIEYLYAETSSPTAAGDFIWLKSPDITIHNNDTIRIAYNGGNGQNSTSGLSGSQTLYVRFGS